MGKHIDQLFLEQSIVIDGDEYIGCTFSRCKLVYAGGTLPMLVNNSYKDCQWAFDGPAARTIQFMGLLYTGGGKSVIEATIENVRGKHATGLALTGT